LQMEWLVVIHVVSAVLGLGPAFAFPWMLRKTESAAEMEANLAQVLRLETFPKVFGSLALLSGLGLAFAGSYGSFAQLWLAGSLVLYVAIQAVVLGGMNPAVRKLQRTLAEAAGAAERRSLEAASALYARVRILHGVAGALSLLILLLMIAKPR